MKVKLVKESLNEYMNNNRSSLFVQLYKEMMGNPANFSEYTIGDMLEDGSLDEYEYEAREGDPNADVELNFLRSLPQDFGTWSIHAEEEEFGGEFEFEKFGDAVLNQGNFKQISPRLFFDEQGQTGYLIENFENEFTPGYHMWFFKI